jgi:hypothetical protein
MTDDLRQRFNVVLVADEVTVKRLTGATFLGFDANWTPRLLKPRRWKPYNLSPTAKIRETIRPHLERQGVKLGMGRTKIQAILMSLLLAAGLLLVLSGTFAIIVN